MSGSANYRPVVLIRRALLVGLVLVVGAVAAIFINNRMRAADATDADSGSSLDSSLADIIFSGKGFDHEVTDGEQRLFHIRADRVLTDRDNVVTLEGIVLTVERASGEIFELAADAGRYRAESNTAEVEGNVVLTGPDGIELRGQRFELQRRGTLVKSRSPVAFSIAGRLSGSATELEGYLDKNRYQLTGKVRVLGRSDAGEEDLVLVAKRVLYEQDSGQIHAEGGVELRRGRDRLTCQRIAVSLDERSRPRFVRARWDVAGILVSDDPRGFERHVQFAGDTLSLDYGQGDGSPRLAEVAGTALVLARFEQGDETGEIRRLVTGRIEATFEDGRVSRAATGGPVVVSELLRFDPGNELGRVCGNQASAKFGRLGDLVELKMHGDVDLHRPGLHTTGDDLVTVGEDLVEVTGAPARVFTREGELSAPKLSYRSQDKTLKAGDGVRAWFPPGGDFTMVQATDSADGKPVQVTSKTAQWAQASGRFRFDGDVRAWQGDSFLTAKSLIGERDGRLRGEGGVKTVLARDRPEDRDDEGGGPVEVTAESLSYSRPDKLIEYRGRPEARDSGRLMICDELDVRLGEASRLSSLRCSGNVLIDDRLGGRKVRGSEALYRPDDSKVEVTGAPAILENPDGAVIKAKTVIYDFQTITARFLSASSTAEAVEATDG